MVLVTQCFKIWDSTFWWLASKGNGDVPGRGDVDPLARACGVAR